MVGETALVPMLLDGDKLIAFCTFALLDDIQPTDMSPWIGFVYTFPDYRGHRYVGMLYDKGKCPNIDCCEKKGLDGCYECEDLKECEGLLSIRQ